VERIKKEKERETVKGGGDEFKDTEGGKGGGEGERKQL